MIDKCEALTLRVVPFSETSHMVTWLTRDSGRLVTVVKGACRPKSLFVGQYDLYYNCEIVFYRKDRDGVHILKECCPLNPRPGFRTDWRSAAAAAYAVDLISRVSLDNHSQPELYELATRALDHLERNTPQPALLFWFELRVLAALGLSPQLDTCIRCGRLFDAPAAAPVRPRFSAHHGGLLCRDCGAAPGTGATPVTLPPDVISLLRRWQKTGEPRIAQNTRCSPGQSREIGRLLLDFLHYHIEHLPVGRETVLDLLA